MEALRTARTNDAILSEEEPNNLARCGKRRVWIIAPLDGTREYGEKRTDWAVHVALAIDGRAAVGAVALPALGVTFRSDSCVPPPLNGERPRMLVSRTRPAVEAGAVAEKLGADVVPMGSAGAKAMAVVPGEADIYLHTGGQYEWDSCAPVAVAMAAGLHVSRADGSPLIYNSENPYLPSLVICPPNLANLVIGHCAEYRTGRNLT